MHFFFFDFCISFMFLSPLHFCWLSLPDIICFVAVFFNSFPLFIQIMVIPDPAIFWKFNYQFLSWNVPRYLTCWKFYVDDRPFWVDFLNALNILIHSPVINFFQLEDLCQNPCVIFEHIAHSGRCAVWEPQQDSWEECFYNIFKPVFYCFCFALDIPV